ncbi:hypothetical protein GCM10010335_24570 [Streptomyces galbus]|nr:hypothetical protein GCM10010335_24570 [Streptomyces galbus]
MSRVAPVLVCWVVLTSGLLTPVADRAPGVADTPIIDTVRTLLTCINSSLRASKERLGRASGQVCGGPGGAFARVLRQVGGGAPRTLVLTARGGQTAPDGGLRDHDRSRFPTHRATHRATLHGTAAGRTTPSLRNAPWHHRGTRRGRTDRHGHA